MRRGCHTSEGCVMCGTDTRETDVHLFWTYPFFFLGGIHKQSWFGSVHNYCTLAHSVVEVPPNTDGPFGIANMGNSLGGGLRTVWREKKTIRSSMTNQI